MKVSELRKYPKIDKLMEGYWSNDCRSGKWDTENITERLGATFYWDSTDEGYDFWAYLDRYSEEECKEKYPEYFTLEDTPVKELPLWEQYPKLKERVISLFGYAPETGDHMSGSLMVILKNGDYALIPNWEGAYFWVLVAEGRLDEAIVRQPQYFIESEGWSASGKAGEEHKVEWTKEPEVNNPITKVTFGPLKGAPKRSYYSDTESTIEHYHMVGGNELPTTVSICLLLNSTNPITLKDPIPHEKLMAIMSEIEDFYEEGEVNTSVKVEYLPDGSGRLVLVDCPVDGDRDLLKWGGG